MVKKIHAEHFPADSDGPYKETTRLLGVLTSACRTARTFSPLLFVYSNYTKSFLCSVSIAMHLV